MSGSEVFDVSVLPQLNGKTYIASVTARGWQRSTVGTSERDALIELVQDLARQLEKEAAPR